MKKLYLLFSVIYCIFLAAPVYAQKCDSLHVFATPSESRCASTGSISIKVTGGSGTYKYKAVGALNTNFTTSNIITGLSAGNYSITVNDIVSNCTVTVPDIIVTGSYTDPRYGLVSENVSCDNGTNGSIKVTGLENGRAPFVFTIMEPSPAQVGVSNNNGQFENLTAGDYRIRLTDSCGGIQTRTVPIQNYSWQIDSYSFTKTSCDSASGSVKVSDNSGNTSNGAGMAGFSFAAVTTAGDTTWMPNTEFHIGAYGKSSVDILVKDGCGKIKTVTSALSFVPEVAAKVTISDKECTSYKAAVSGIVNFTNPTFSLYTGAGALTESNTTGSFSSLKYNEDYYITAHDACSDTTIKRTFNEKPPVISINSNVKISNTTCDAFDAKVTGLVGFTGPIFILLKDGYEFISLNHTGTFTSLPYGNYCVIVQDNCRDTSITKCFTSVRPLPKIPSQITPAYIKCETFGLAVKGENVTSPLYCLYDNDNVKISCNETGVFDSLPFGKYCLTIHDDCTDTTITRCFEVTPPKVVNDIKINESSKTCYSFTATVASQNFKNAQFCLYTNDSTLIDCNATGVFKTLSYGSFYVVSKNVCPDTTVITRFTAVPPVPAIGATVSITNKSCNTFSASVSGQKNLTSPHYTLFDTKDAVLATNLSGKFDNLAYGSYKIKVTNSCYDTTMQVSFSGSQTPVNLTATAAKSCAYGYSKFSVTLSGNYPVRVSVTDPLGNVFYEANHSTATVSIENVPGLDSGKTYSVKAVDACGNNKTISLAPVTGFLTHSVKVVNKCPGSLWTSGSGDIIATVSSNRGTLNVRAIKKDGVSLSPVKAPNSSVGGEYRFNDMGPGTYILRYFTNDGCNAYLYDTVVVPPYNYPELSKSSAYECDVNGYSVGAVVTNGVAPFTYSVIGSSPEEPSIIAGPQAVPVFNINNGSEYSLIRLRAMDACGNATLGDASILPLASNSIHATYNCFGLPTTLTIDTIYNATTSWFKKQRPESTDSIYLGSGFSYFIPEVKPQDTGIYICNVSINNGCIERVYSFTINGNCHAVLPVMLSDFAGKFEKDNVLLNWNVSNGNELKEMFIEKKTGAGFIQIGKVLPVITPAKTAYQYLDENASDENYYRIRLVTNSNAVIYTKIIRLQKEEKGAVSIYPNPVGQTIYVNFKKADNHVYRVSLTNVLNQKLKEIHFTNAGGVLEIERSKNMTAGMYILHFWDTQTNQAFSHKLIFK